MTTQADVISTTQGEPLPPGQNKRPREDMDTDEKQRQLNLNLHDAELSNTGVLTDEPERTYKAGRDEQVNVFLGQRQGADSEDIWDSKWARKLPKGTTPTRIYCYMLDLQKLLGTQIFRTKATGVQFTMDMTQFSFFATAFGTRFNKLGLNPSIGMDAMNYCEEWNNLPKEERNRIVMPMTMNGFNNVMGTRGQEKHYRHELIVGAPFPVMKDEVKYLDVVLAAYRVHCQLAAREGTGKFCLQLMAQRLQDLKQLAGE
jgi:hypothetical protein